MPAVAVKPDGSVKEFTVKLGALTDAERQILADGCLINYYKNKLIDLMFQNASRRTVGPGREAFFVLEKDVELKKK